MELGLTVLGLVLYFLLWIVAVILLFLYLRIDTQNACYKMSIQKMFFIFLLSFITARWIWLLIKHTTQETWEDFVLNRLAFCLFLTSFTIVIAYWIEVYHKNYVENPEYLSIPMLKWGLFVTNLIIYLLEFLVTILYFRSHEATVGREGNVYYESSILNICLVSLVLAISFLVYGIRQFWMLFQSGDDSNERTRELIKIGFVTSIFSGCFLGRVIMFLYRPIAGTYLPMGVFMTFGYYLPEIVPSLLQLYILTNSKQKSSFETGFIDSLYSESETDRTFSRMVSLE